MKKIYLEEEQDHFICPVTQEVIIDLSGDGDFNPSPAMLFCFIKSDCEFLGDSEWGEEQLEQCKNEFGSDDFAFQTLLNKEFTEYPELACYIVKVPGGGHLNHTDTLYFGIDAGYANKKANNQKIEENTITENYSRKQTSTELYIMLTPEKEPLLDHNGDNFPKLSENVSRNLLGDLNDIFDYNETNHNFGGGHEEELKRSFFYCVISTMQAYAKEGILPQLEVSNQIQWDSLFRLSLESPNLLFQLKVTEKSREFLGDLWVDLPLNHEQSIEGMGNNDVPFVPEKTIKLIKELSEIMTPSELVMVDILHNFFEHFSITLSILWVSGKIGDEDFISAYWALYQQEDFYSLNETDYEYPRFLMNRLLFLKTLRYSYLWEDESLPTL